MSSPDSAAARRHAFGRMMATFGGLTAAFGYGWVCWWGFDWEWLTVGEIYADSARACGGLLVLSIVAVSASGTDNLEFTGMGVITGLDHPRGGPSGRSQRGASLWHRA